MVDFSSNPELRAQIAALQQSLSAERSDGERLSEALAQAGIGHFEWDLVGQTIYVSPLLQAMLGHGPHDSMPSDPIDWLRYVRDDDRYRLQREMREALAYGKTSFEESFPIVRLDGIGRRFLFRASITRNSRIEGGEATRVLGVAIDITGIAKWA